MFCIPEFGTEVTSTLWDPSIVHILDHTPVINPTSQIFLSREFTGSSCSLFATNPSQSTISTEDEELPEHTSPATIGTTEPTL